MSSEIPESIEYIRKIEGFLKARIMSYKHWVPELIELDIPLDPSKPHDLENYKASLLYMKALFYSISLNYKDRKGRKSFSEDQFCLMNRVSSLYVEKENLLLVNVLPNPNYVTMLIDYRDDADGLDFVLKTSPLSRRWFEVFKFFIEQNLLRERGDDVYIKYKDFCKWVPIEEKETKRTIEKQLRELHEPFFEFGLIKGFSLERKEDIKQPYWLMKYGLSVPETWKQPV